MIPIRLSVSGFLSYREPVELDFTPLHVAVILGNNGAGKSSLLDAMTWALFGKARAKNGDDIINTVSEDRTARVTFEFLFEDRLYRVQREKPFGKPMKVDLLTRDADDPVWRVISAKKGLETTGQIADILRMDYETFINASFFLQGHADQFTSAKPAERKKILNRILNLDIWDTYRLAAMDKQKEAEYRQQTIQAEIERNQTELDEEPQRLSHLAEVEAALKFAEEEQKVARANYNAAKSADETLRGKQQLLETLCADESRKTKSLQGLERQLAEKQASLAEIEKRLEDREQAAQDYLRLGEIKTALQAMSNTALTYHSLSGTRENLNTAIRAESRRLSDRLAALERREPAYQKAVADKAVLVPQLAQGVRDAEVLRRDCAELPAVSARLPELAREIAERTSRREQLRAKAVEKQQKLIGYNRQTQAQTELRAKLDGLLPEEQSLRAECADLPALNDRLLELAAEISETNSHREQLTKEANEKNKKRDAYQAGLGMPCPFCGRDLDEAHLAEYSREIEAELETLRLAYQTDNRKLTALKAEKADKTAQKAELERKQKKLNELTPEIREIQAQLKNTEQILADLEREERDEYETLVRDGHLFVDCRDLIAAEIEFLRLCFVEEGKKVDALKAEQEEQNAGKNLLEAEQEKLNEAERQISAWRIQLSNAEKTIADWERDEKTELETLRRLVPAGEFALEERQKLHIIEEQLAALHYDPAAHEELKRKAASLADVEARYQAVQLAVGAEGPAREMVNNFAEQVKTAREDLQAACEKRKTAEEELSLYRQTVPDLEAADHAYESASEAVKNFNRDLGVARQLVAVLTGVRETLEKNRLKEKETNDLINGYKDLVKAFGVKGIPALLMEQALPELEEKANDILQQLSDGDMSLQFRTEAAYASKSAEGKKQTLDILISDAYGTREYDMFSGGEAFRINFSVRLALSKLLARRAGSRLQTLVIDEGFGSQDEEGRQRLVEAINTVSGEFEKILIITHLPELKEAFTSSIEVVKDASGSHAEVHP